MQQVTGTVAENTEHDIGDKFTVTIYSEVLIGYKQSNIPKLFISSNPFDPEGVILYVIALV
jgi:hypothetical protein